jgi:DNA-binding NarL/FixJ family response regulator
MPGRGQRKPFSNELFHRDGTYYSNRVISEREIRVIRLVSEGLKNKEIGAVVGSSEHVVKNYIRVIYDKLGLWNRVELALWYVSKYENGARREVTQ